MVYFVGAGSGAADLITVRGMHMLQQAADAMKKAIFRRD